MKKFFFAFLISKSLQSHHPAYTLDAAFFRKRQKTEAEVLENLARCEYEMINRYSGLKVGETIQVYDVPIELNGKQEKIHTTRSGDNQKENLVIIHGYLVGLVSFFRMLDDLSKHYKVYCIDLPGMGLSSRPDFTCQSTEETIEFFTEAIEQWRKNAGIEKFHLAGLSFGGYMSAMYALKYPEHVKKLMLLSPAGVSRPTPEEQWRKELQQLPWHYRKVFDLFISIWKNQYRPHDLNKISSIFRNPLLNLYVKRAKLVGEEHKFGYQYMDSLLQLPESTLKSVHLILTLPRAAGHMPLEDHLHKLKMPCEIYYGEWDWVSSEGAKRVVADKKIKGGFHIIPNAGHPMNFENPKYLAQLMISHMLKEGEENQGDNTK